MSVTLILVADVEVLVNINSVSLNIVKSLPDSVSLLQEPLISDQEVESPLVLAHAGEVVVAEEHGHLPLLYDGVELADAVVGQLTGGLLQELLC